MNPRKIAIVGATGFLGRATAKYFNDAGWKTIGLTRQTGSQTPCQEHVIWNPHKPETITPHLEGIDAVVNLAGRSVDCRYNRKNKAEILHSRIETTRAIEKAIESCQHPPKTWLNAASATIYEAAFDRPQTEKDGTLGHGFSVSVCRAWENAFFETPLPATRKIALRTALVLGHGANSVYPRLAQLARFGLGGTIGDGNQMVSWIHELDFVRALDFLIENEPLDGVLNVAAPAPVANQEFMRVLRHQVGCPFGLPTPKWLLEIGTFILRTEPELVQKSRYVLPERLLRERFQFRYPFIDEAFADLAGRAKGTSDFAQHRPCVSA